MIPDCHQQHIIPDISAGNHGEVVHGLKCENKETVRGSFPQSNPSNLMTEITRKTFLQLIFDYKDRKEGFN